MSKELRALSLFSYQKMNRMQQTLSGAPAGLGLLIVYQHLIQEMMAMHNLVVVKNLHYMLFQ